jgi:hypothetical protein
LSNCWNAVWTTWRSGLASSRPFPLDGETQTARLTHLPDGDAAPFPLDLQRVVEYYATRM